MGKSTISNFMTILGLVNGMIGGTILILPILGESSGYINTLLICVSMGVIQFYTAYLIIVHLGKCKGIKESVLAHFNHDYRYVKIYSLIIWISFLPIFLIYFRLIVLQFEGLFGESQFTAPLSALALFIAICLVRIWDVGEETLALGIISIFIYLAFLIWAQMTAPEGEKEVAPFGATYPLAATLMMAYSNHNIITQNIFKNPNRKEYGKIIAYTFACGIVAYTFIAYGSYAIVNRQAIKSNPQTIEDYFEMGGWQVTIIELLYLVHLFTAFPNFMIVSKRRFYEIIEVQLKKQVTWHEILFIFITVTLPLLVYLTGMRVDVMIEINGSVIGYVYAFLIPICMHLKCVYFDCSSGFIKGESDHNLAIRLNECECENQYSSKWSLYFQTAVLILILLLGLALMIGTLIGLLNK